MSNPNAALDALLFNFQDQLGNIKNAGPQQRGTCAHCYKPIFGELVEASGKSYHPEHHVCQVCSKPIAGGSYYEPDNQTWCESCYKSKHVPVCAGCGRDIEDRIVNALDKAWHYNHFTCDKCHEPLADREFFVDGGKAYCEKDYHSSFVKRCSACGTHIKGAMVTAVDKHYCETCFKCHHPGCGEVLGGKSFYEHDGKPYCKQHYQVSNDMVCPCGRGIGKGQYASAQGRKWHTECFVCGYCKKTLIGLSFAEDNGKVYCVPCYEKLF